MKRSKLVFLLAITLLVGCTRSKTQTTEKTEKVSSQSIATKKEKPSVFDEIVSGALDTDEKKTKEIERISQLLKKSPDKIDLYKRRGMIYFHKASAISTRLDGSSGRSKAIYQKAIADFNKVTETVPDDVDALRWRAEANISIGDSKAALEDADKIKAIEPYSEISKTIKARAYRNDKQFDKALEQLNELIADLEKDEQKQSTALTYMERGDIYYDSGDYDKCIADYKKGFSLLDSTKPLHAVYVSRFHATLSSAYFKKKEFNNAILECKATIDTAKEVPCPPFVYINLGDAYSAKGEHQKAVESYEEAIKHYSDYKKAYLQCSNELKAMGQTEKAEEYKKKYESLGM